MSIHNTLFFRLYHMLVPSSSQVSSPVLTGHMLTGQRNFLEGVFPGCLGEEGMFSLHPMPGCAPSQGTLATPGHTCALLGLMSTLAIPSYMCTVLGLMSLATPGHMFSVRTNAYPCYSW